MIVYFVLLGLLLILFFASAHMTLPEKQKIPMWKVPFYKSACLIIRSRRKTADKEKMWEQTEKIGDALLILFLGLGITLLAENLSVQTGKSVQLREVLRPENGAGSETQKLQVQVEGMTEAAEVEVTISEREYTEAEKTAFLEQALQELDTLILGDNTSPNEVRNQIILPDELLDGKVSIQWTKECEWDGEESGNGEESGTGDDVVDEDGVISPDVPQEGVLLQIRGTLVCQDQEAIFQRALRLYPPIRSEEEQLLYELEKQVAKTDQNTLEETQLSLPTKVQGKSVLWKKQEESWVWIGLMVTLAAAVGSYLGKEQELRKQEEKRKQQLIMDFPGMLFQLAMLLEAGLTMQNAFFHMAWNYRERKDKERRLVYEEMLVSCYEMQSGVAERKAYENFGKRCKENCYVRFGTILSSGLQKGAQGLTGVLLDEAQNALEVRRQLAKKLGEEAGTKLLLPMVLMLVVVLVILMVPAMLSF